MLLNGQKRKFILDSGSPMVILNSKYIEQDSTERKISSVEGVNGKISGMDIENSTFDIEYFCLFLTINLCANLRPATGHFISSIQFELLIRIIH